MGKGIFEGLICMDARWIPVSVKDVEGYPRDILPYCQHDPYVIQGKYGKYVTWGSMANILIMAGSKLLQVHNLDYVHKKLAIFTLRKHHRNYEHNNYNPPVLCEDENPTYRVAFSDEVDWDNVSLL